MVPNSLSGFTAVLLTLFPNCIDRQLKAFISDIKVKLAFIRLYNINNTSLRGGGGGIGRTDDHTHFGLDEALNVSSLV